MKLGIRRLPGLGTLAHQPAIAAYCKVTKQERDTIIESLLMQKVGSNPKMMKQFKEMREASAAMHHVTPLVDEGKATTA